MDKTIGNLREFYRKVKLWREKAPLERWAREDVEELLTDHKEGA